ncbi:MAG: hypothetical protein ACPGUV_09570 [Polyangiales bacterium]
MPFPTLFALALVTGIAAALAGRGEIRSSPRPAWLTYSFGAYLLFLTFLLIPVSLYFYLFHGDWFLLYLIDVGRIPSALALLGFAAQAGLGSLGFVIGATTVRMQRESVGAVVALICLVLAVALVLLLRQRLAVVGTYSQYQTGLGLEAYGSGALWQGTIAMSVLLFSGLAYLLVRLYLSVRRTS